MPGPGQSKIRALVSGYYGFGNTGDEAMLAGLLAGFRHYAPEFELTVLSGNPAATQAEHGVPALPRGISATRAQLRHFDLFISGGGGLIQDATSWRSPLYYLGLMWLARRAGLPVVCLGQSVGPLSRGWIRALARRLFSQVQVLAVRDRRSQAILQSLGVRREVHVTGDLALLLPPPEATEIHRVWQKAGLVMPGEPAAAIAVRRLPQHDHGRGRDIAEAAVAVCREVHLRPIFVPMQFPHDLELAEEVAQAMHVGEVVRRALTAREMIALLGGFDLVIAMRLHALILAALCGRPLVAVSYDPKVDGLMGELGLPVAASVENFAASSFHAAVMEAWRSREDLARHITERVTQLQRAAHGNIELTKQSCSRTP